MNKILEISNIQKYYHTEKEEIYALKNISFDVEEGEFISIIGPSGCGKSTLLSILAGMEKESNGTISILNGYQVAYMLQEDSLLPFRTVLENCCIGLEVQGLLTKENKEYVISLLDTYGLHDFMNLYPSSLSGGMRQRVL